MSWAEFKVLKDNIDAGIVSLPTLIIKDTLGIMQGKTLTITDENEYFTHQVVFPSVKNPQNANIGSAWLRGFLLLYENTYNGTCTAIDFTNAFKKK